jgi:transcriptional regulator
MLEYLTERYRSADLDKVLFLIEHFPLATLVPGEGTADGFAFVPVVAERTGDAQFELLGHIDNCNPFLRQLDGSRLRAVFHGPNAYISPVDYASHQFPTWNYAVVEAVGVTSLVRDEQEKLEGMIRMVDRLEQVNGSSYRLDPSDSRVLGLIRRITFFRIEVEAVGGVFKFAQEKSFADRIRAHHSLVRKSQRTLERVLPRLADDLDKSGEHQPLAEARYGG